jgi:hypothetical protein
VSSWTKPPAGASTPASRSPFAIRVSLFISAPAASVARPRDEPFGRRA